jgi:hypothetical protein
LPLPRWAEGSWPDSHDGIVTGLGTGGATAAPCIDRRADGAGTGTVGITDSSQARLFVGSSTLSPFSTSTMSYLAATRLAFDVRCTLSPAQMLVPSTVVRSWKEDSAEPKKLRMLTILALPVLWPTAATSARLFSAPDRCELRI